MGKLNPLGKAVPISEKVVWFTKLDQHTQWSNSHEKLLTFPTCWNKYRSLLRPLYCRAQQGITKKQCMLNTLQLTSSSLEKCEFSVVFFVFCHKYGLESLRKIVMTGNRTPPRFLFITQTISVTKPYRPPKKMKLTDILIEFLKKLLCIY